MKTKFSKRILSIFLAVMMVVTSIPMFALTASAADVSALQTAISNYESKMNGTIYHNMKDAYDKYVKACEAYDAIVYGEDTIDAAQVASSLSSATDAMTAFTAPLFNSEAKHVNAVATGGYSNVAYFLNTHWGGMSGTDSMTQKAYVKFKPAVPGNLVLVDDGVNDVYSPLVMQIQNGDTVGSYNKSKTFRYIKLNSSGNNNIELSLQQNWTLKNASWDSWIDPTTPVNPIAYYDNSDQRSTAVNNTNDNWQACNRLYFKAKTSEGNTTSYYDHFTTDNLKFGVRVYSTWQNAIWQNKSADESAEVYCNGVNYYVINYRPIKTRLNTLGQYIKGISVSNYKEGGLSSVLEMLDKCTADNVNPMTYAYDGDVANKVAECAGNIAAVAGTAVPGAPVTDAGKYQALRTAIANKVTSFDGYTAESKAQYEKILSAAKDIMKDVFYNGYTKGESAKTNAQLLVDNKDSVLNPLVDTSALSTAINTKRNATSIFDSSNKQVYTYASWESLMSDLANAESYRVNTMALMGQYNVTENGGTYATLTGNSNYDLVDRNSSTTVVTDKINEINSLALTALDIEGYNNFDAAKTVVDSIDRAKYTDSALSAFDNAITTAYNKAYVAATQAQAQAYGSPITEGYLLRIKEGSLDPLTKDLLNAVNTLNSAENKDANVNKYSANVYDEDGILKKTLNGYYGESFIYSLTDSIADDDVVTWHVTVYKNDTDMNKALGGDDSVQPINSQVVSTYNGNTIERTANGSMCIQYFIKEGSKADTTTYKVYNAYGNVIDVVYSTDTLDSTYFAENYANPVLPFYTFSGWNVGTANAKGVVNVRPEFDSIPTKSVTVDTTYATVDYSKATGANAVVGSTVTITGNSSDIYGWAVEADGKYQIVGYGKDYKFNVYADEHYVPVLYTDGSYTVNGDPLTADKVAGFSNNSNGKLSDDAYLKAKLDSKAPFVYVQVNNVTYTDGSTEKIKFYIRVTAGSVADNLAYGITVDGRKIASTAKNEGGQFYMATTMDNYNNITSINAFVSYTFDYSYNGTKATITTVDYATVK